MAHAEPIDLMKENRRLGDLGTSLSGVSFLVGIVGFLVAIALGYFSGSYGSSESSGMVRLQYAYLHAFVYYLSITLGGVFFTIALYLTGGKWGIAIRRVPELVAANAPIMAILVLPILIPLLMGNHSLYEWANHDVVQKDELLKGKAPWLNVSFFTIRLILYFSVWSLLGLFFFRNSVRCDEIGDHMLHFKAKWWSPLSMIAWALTTTFASFDLLMSLTPHWYSTIFGVYFFAGSAIGIFAFTILSYRFLQAKGILVNAVTTEHYHDLGKLLFAFVFFWGYIAFSQYMLIWYANVPEETAFYRPRQESWAWIGVSLLLLFGHLLIPFPGLLSRWVKRSKPLLIFWAIWMLIAHWIDHYYIITPTWAGHVNHDLLKPIDPPLPFMEIACTIGMGGIWLGALIRRAATVSLIPEKDPYIKTSLAFHNF